MSNLGQKQGDHDQLYLLSGGAPQQSPWSFSRRTIGANTFAWREKMKGRLLGKTRSALTFLMFAAAQTHFSALAQPASPPPPLPPPVGQHPALLASYAKRPPWKVAGVDYAVGVPPTATLTDWQLLSGPGITVNTTAMPPYVRVDNTSNVVISGVDFSLHGGAEIFFVNSPNPTVTGCQFGGTNLAHVTASIIAADSDSPNLTVSYNTVDGGGNGAGSSLVSTAGAGTMTLTYNWLKNFSQHVLELIVSGTASPWSLTYKYNLIEQGGMTPGAHLNYLQIEANTDSTSIDVEYNTSYQTWQATGGEGYQFNGLPPAKAKNITFAYNVMIAAPTPGHPRSISRMIHADGFPNVPATAHDNYVDRTGAYGWLYYGSFTGWNVYNNYNMKTGAIMPASY
jgi:hypothetical protein